MRNQDNNQRTPQKNNAKFTRASKPSARSCISAFEKNDMFTVKLVRTRFYSASAAKAPPAHPARVAGLCGKTGGSLMSIQDFHGRTSGFLSLIRCMYMFSGLLLLFLLGTETRVGMRSSENCVFPGKVCGKVS